MYVSTKAFSSRKPVEPVAEPARLVDNPFAPDLFVTGCAGIACIGGTIAVTLDNARCDHSQKEPTLERMVVGRLAMTVPAAQILVTALNDFLEQHGMSPSKALADGAVFQ